MGNLVTGGLIAGAVAALLLVATVGGEDGWKFALAAIGMLLWVAGGLWKEP